MTKINHLGIIVDGNGRWAKERGLSRSEGHKAGAKNLEKLILHMAHEEIVNYLSLYVFSTENFSRSEDEVNYLMNLFIEFFNMGKAKYDSENIKVVFSGRKSYLSAEVRDAMNEIEKRTKEHDGMVVNFCLSYGGRAEIVDATKKIAEQVSEGSLSVDDIDELVFAKNLYHELPDMDFLIRTSGENRISNFMLWQVSYAEFYFPKTYFPDFDIKCLNEAIEEFTKRDRRFGNIKNN